PRGLALCNAQGERLAPLAGEVFEKGGSVAKTDEGERLRFVAQSSGRYTVTVAAADQARELLVRRRPGGTSASPVVSATLGAGQSGIASSGAPMVFAFAAPAGQWVELKSTSEKDTVLRLAGPDRAGDYAVIAENDDSEGLNPIIRRRLPAAGTYYVQVDSLSDEPGEFQLALNRIEAPKPPPPPAVLRPGATVSGRLADGDDARLYALPVVAGRSYRLELTAPYDGVVGIGLPNPVEPEGGDARDAGFAEVKSQDSGTTGTERLTFTARNSGQLLVRVKSFGIGDSDGAYTLVAKDLGG
ncbi:MAG TPA: PPC domain-containing protein, partial [Novosphingobium sp.]